MHAAFHYITLLDFITNAVREGRPRFMKGYDLDVLGDGRAWAPSDEESQRYPTPILRQPNMMAAYIPLPDNPIGRIASLVGSDASRQLAFDIWEATTPQDIGNYISCQGGDSARATMPACLASAFDPQPPGTKMTKLRKYDITVSSETDPRVEHSPYHSLRIYCYKKTEAPVVKEPELPAYQAASAPALKAKSSSRGVWKSVTALGQRKSQASWIFSQSFNDVFSGILPTPLVWLNLAVKQAQHGHLTICLSHRWHC